MKQIPVRIVLTSAATIPLTLMAVVKMGRLWSFKVMTILMTPKVGTVLGQQCIFGSVIDFWFFLLR
jgi:hypothetical protein